MARLTTSLTALAVGLAPGLVGAQPAPRPAQPPAAQYQAPQHQGPLVINPTIPLTPERRSPGLNLEPSSTGPGGLRLPDSSARISPTLSPPTSTEAPPHDRPEGRVPGVRLRVPW
jgi:hypothetical protein